MGHRTPRGVGRLDVSQARCTCGGGLSVDMGWAGREADPGLRAGGDDAVYARNRREVMRLYEEMFERGVDPLSDEIPGWIPGTLGADPLDVPRRTDHVAGRAARLVIAGRVLVRPRGHWKARALLLTAMAGQAPRAGARLADAPADALLA